MTMEKAFALGHGIRAREGKAYLRFEFDVLVGRKPAEI